MKAKLIRILVEWLNKKYPYLLQEIVVGHDKHIHRNPIKKPKEASDV